jgi:hypothetical protein
MSVTGWALMALRSARNNGAGVPTESIDEAIRFIMNCRHGSGGFTYQPGGDPGLGRTGTALLCLELTGHHRSRASLFAGDWILKNLRRVRSEFYYYAMYYSAQGMFQLGEEEWDGFAPKLQRVLLDRQHGDGHWELPPDNKPQSHLAGTAYATALAVLTLSLDKQYLPMYQRQKRLF